MTHKPILGISVGDPAGIGPEIILKSLVTRHRDFVPLLIGKLSIFQFYNDLHKIGLSFYPISEVSQIGESEKIPVLDIMPDEDIPFTPGIPSIPGARLAMEAVRTGAELALHSKTAALITAPIHKKGINDAGYRFHGHTDFLAAITNTEKYAMMLVGGGLRVVLVTIHIPFHQILAHLTVDAVYSTIEITHDGLTQFGIAHPRIALCGLNPHAGEEGLLGTEEITVLKPALERAKARGITVTGIYPPDTIYWEALGGACDVVIALYHDQGLIPIKALAFDKGVNVTLGLPVIRTSPDHGTAFAIAGKNSANPESFKEAIRVARNLVRLRHDG